MKKYIYGFMMMLLAAVTMSSCAVDEGTYPGNDSRPAVTIYQYKVAKPYNPDNDVTLRFATNNKTVEAYYLAETKVDKEARVASVGEDGYMDYVVSKGVKLNEVSGESNVDVVLTGLFGTYTITAVAVNEKVKSSAETSFTGLQWELLGEADVVSEMFGSFSTEVYKAVQEDWYKFPSIFEDGKDLVVKVNGTNVTIDKQNIYTHKSYGAMYAAGGGKFINGQLQLSIEYTVSAGTFGVKQEVITLPTAK